MVYQSYADDDRANQLSLLKIASPILLTLLVIDEHDHTIASSIPVIGNSLPGEKAASFRSKPYMC